MSDLKVIYEDNHIIVVEKPVNVPSQQDKTNDIDMLTIIKQYLKEKYNKPGNVYLGLIHRLDRPVGGVMVFAKTSKAAARLSEQVRNKEFKKKYLAIVDGKMENGSGVLEDYLLKNERTNTSKVVEEGTKNAKYANLEYEVIAYNEETDLSLVKVTLHTGRHHQIRLQFANFRSWLIRRPKVRNQRKGQTNLLMGIWTNHNTPNNQGRNDIYSITKTRRKLEDIRVSTS